MIVTQVDAFTDTVFGGNPAAVCVLPKPRSEVWMQRLAGEMNLSETAFLERRADGEFDLRWFTPIAEVELCGHATLASAHVLWEQRVCAPAGLLDALGAPVRYFGRSRFDYLVELESEAAVRRLRPDLYRLRAIEARGVIVTAGTTEPGFDFVSRYFAPAFGIDEDPVTGSAHCCLGPYWRGRMKQDAFTARQVSARGGVVRVRVDGSRVKLSGQAVTVFSAELR